MEVPLVLDVLPNVFDWHPWTVGESEESSWEEHHWDKFGIVLQIEIMSNIMNNPYCANRDICNGLRCNLPSSTKSAVALSFPKREWNCLAETVFVEGTE